VKFFDVSNLRGDMFGGITAGIIALPLALAFGEASGAGPIAGIWGAIFVGFFASLFGGTGSNVSGPTGPMVVVFAGVFASLSGNLALVFAAVVLAGLLQILLQDGPVHPPGAVPGRFRFHERHRLHHYCVTTISIIWSRARWRRHYPGVDSNSRRGHGSEPGCAGSWCDNAGDDI